VVSLSLVSIISYEPRRAYCSPWNTAQNCIFRSSNP
jgi:hypothetical protein